jgi:hypothetical protein
MDNMGRWESVVRETGRIMDKVYDERILAKEMACFSARMGGLV